MDPKANLWREITGIEAELRSPRLTRQERAAKKRRLGRLRAQYDMGRGVTHGYPRIYGDWHPGDEM